MKKVWTRIGVIAFIFTIFLGKQGIYAWFVSKDTAVNLFTVGTNDVDIEEEFPEDDIIPGKTLTKIVSFTNTGTVSCFVRAKYSFSTLEAEQQTEIIFGSELWVKQEDGYFYYQNSVLPGEKTEPFLIGTAIKENCSFDEGFRLDVYTETVQWEENLTAEDAFLHLKR